MIPLPLDEIAALQLGELELDDGADQITGVQVDSRRIVPGDLFVAIGEGERFRDDAYARGAVATLVPSDAFAAMAALGRAVRARSRARVVAITGSYGKTTTKDILASIAIPQRPTVAAERSFNNEIGVPLTLCRLEPQTEICITELAMRGFGQIAELAAIAEPEVAVITNVGPVHVELLGSVAAIAAAKAEILDDLPPGGTAVAPVAAGELEPHLRRVAQQLRFGSGGDVEATEVKVDEGVTEALVSTPLGAQRFHFPFTEAHNLTNALAAIAAGVAFGADLAGMADRAASIGFSRFRGERMELPGGIVLVNDCYNANPVSMRAALDHLATLEAPRTVAVLGEMGELGPGAAGYHREVGEHARAAGIDYLIGVGLPAREYDPDELVADPGEAAELLAAQLEPGDAVLVKGSRSAGLEAVAAQLPDLVAAEDG